PVVDASAKSRPFAMEVTGREKIVNDHAAAVIEADTARTAAAAGCVAGRASADRSLTTIETRASGTLTFIDRLTEYNPAIARYAASGNISDDSVDALMARLMVAF